MLLRKPVAALAVEVLLVRYDRSLWRECLACGVLVGASCGQHFGKLWQCRLFCGFTAVLLSAPDTVSMLIAGCEGLLLAEFGGSDSSDCGLGPMAEELETRLEVAPKRLKVSSEEEDTDVEMVAGPFYDPRRFRSRECDSSVIRSRIQERWSMYLC